MLCLQENFHLIRRFVAITMSTMGRGIPAGSIETAAGGTAAAAGKRTPEYGGFPKENLIAVLAHDESLL